MTRPLTDADLFDEVVVVPQRAYPALPDLRVIERPGWLQIVTPSIKTGGLNEVLYSALAPEEADAVLDATIAEYRALGLKFRWNVGPGSAPADLAARLEERGLVVSWGRGMARVLSASEAPHAQRAATLTTEPVDHTSVDVFTRVMAEGWSLDPSPLAAVHHLAVADPARRQRLFLARWDGEPVAVASYIAFPRSAYLMGAVVLPPHRGRGLYRALVEARLADALDQGIMLATSHARESTSAPILEHLGFSTVCRFPKYFG